VAAQERIQKPAGEAKQDETLHADPADAEQADLSYTDDLMEDIDGLLNELGQDFVANYIQKGGE
jgi:ubiquitin-like protein Pup